METVWSFPQKLKNRTAAISLLGSHPKKIKTNSKKYICTLVFTEALFTITKTQKQPKCPSTDKWIKQL